MSTQINPIIIDKSLITKAIITPPITENIFNLTTILDTTDTDNKYVIYIENDALPK